MRNCLPRPTCFKDETAFHFVHRWAEQLGYASGRQLCSLFGWDYAALFRGKLNVEVAARANLPEDSFESIPGTNLPSIQKAYADLRSVKICTECLKRDSEQKSRRGERPEHLRSWWFLTAMDACPIHRVRLISHHPNTGHAFLFDPMDLKRDCNLEFIKNYEPTPVTETSAESYILTRLELMGGPTASLLDQVPLPVAIELMLAIGAPFTKKVSERVPVISDRNKALNSGYKVVADGIESFSRHLDTLVVGFPKDRDDVSPRQAYGYLYDILDRQKDSLELKPLIEALREHALKTFPFGGHTVLFGRKVRRKGLWTFRQVAYRAGMHHKKAKQILDGMGLLSTTNATAMIFTRKEVAQQLRILRVARSMSWVASRLGMSGEAITSLMHQGFITPILTVGAHTWKQYFFDRHAVSSLLRSARGSTRKVFLEQPDDTDLVQVVARRCYAPWTNVLKLMLDGHLRCVGTLEGQRGINSLLVKTRETKRLLGPQPQQIYITRLMKLLKLPHAAVQELISVGQFRPCVGDGCVVDKAGCPEVRSFKEDCRLIRRTRAICFDPDIVEYFRTHYISGKEIASLHQTTFEQLLPQLQARRVEPMIKISKPIYCFYTRSSVSRWISPRSV